MIVNLKGIFPMIKPQEEREVEDMRVFIRNIPRRGDEQVILECVEMTKDFDM